MTLCKIPVSLVHDKEARPIMLGNTCADVQYTEDIFPCESTSLQPLQPSFIM